MVLVRKKSGSVRLCIDFRKLNEHTLPFDFPLPTFQETTQLLANNKYFSCLDMVSGYHQISLAPEARPYTAFSACGSKFEWSVLPFGLRNGVAIYQEMMNILLGDMQYSRALLYIDDILIFSKTFEEHIDRLIEIFEKFKTHNLKLKTTKCNLLSNQVVFLGHIISEKGIIPDKQKIEAVENFGRPRNKKDVKSFLGLASYFRRFVPNFAQIANPLYEITSEKTPFAWAEKHQAAFIQLKSSLIMPPVLSHPHFEKPFTLYTDASLFGVGGILCQTLDDGGEVVIAYASKKLSDTQTRYTITELELYAVIYAFEQFKCYLHGAPFTIVTDHKPLIWMHSMRDPSARHFRWLMKLQ